PAPPGAEAVTVANRVRGALHAMRTGAETATATRTDATTTFDVRLRTGRTAISRVAGVARVTTRVPGRRPLPAAPFEEPGVPVDERRPGEMAFHVLPAPGPQPLPRLGVGHEPVDGGFELGVALEPHTAPGSPAVLAGGQA